MNPMPAPSERKDLLRAYLLGTLPDNARAEVEKELAQNEQWRAELETERTVLSLLDRLPQEEPPQGLAQRTLASLEELDEARRPESARWLNGLELTIVGSLFVILAIVILPVLGRAREAASRSEDQNNLKQIGVALKMYAGDHGGEYPPLAPYPDVWMFDVQKLYPEYLSDPSMLVSPNHPNQGDIRENMLAAFERKPVDWEAVSRLAAQSYVYTGHAVDDTQELAALRNEVRQLARADAPRPQPLKEGIERFFITDINNPAATVKAQAGIPVVFNAFPPSEDRKQPGINVLYMDGHVEFVRSGMKYPATPEVFKILQPK